MAALSTTPVAVPAGTQIINTGSNVIFYDRQPAPSTARHIGHISAGKSFTFTDDVWIAATMGDTTYTAATIKTPAAWNPTGPWSVATDYKKGDIVTWQGSSFLAVGDVAAGGFNPRLDTSDWLLVAQGGGEIAYAENLTNALISPLPAAADTDVPGLSVNVPANAGAHEVEARVSMVQIQTNAGVVAGELVVIELAIVDEGGIEVALDRWEQVINLATAGKPHQKSMFAKRRMPNNAAQKTYKASMFLTSTNGGHQTVSVWSGPGNETTANSRADFDFTPAYIKASAA